MKKTRTVGVKELKNRLSEYLREVRAGTCVLVSDRGSVVAELHEPAWDRPAAEAGNPVLEEWVGAGVVKLPAGRKEPVPESPLRLPDGTGRRLLEEDRREDRA